MVYDYSPYAGRWIAVIAGRVIGQGGTPEQAEQAAASTRYKETPQIFFVPTKNPLTFPPIFYRVCEILPSDVRKYLVGGAIRDALLSRPIHDFDIILGEKTMKLARSVADRLGGAYFPLDEKRETARVILKDEDSIHVFDFAAIRGKDLESDLRERDFTLNAIALNLEEPEKLLDPLGGGTDLINKVLRACSEISFTSDPVRILRAIRLAAGFDLKILPETRGLMTKAIPFLVDVSQERLRDEIFRILDGPRSATSILAMEILGLLPYLFPELLPLKNLPQSPPHMKDVWLHTLDTLKYLEILINEMVFLPDGERGSVEHSIAAKDSTNMFLSLFKLKLGLFSQKILSHLSSELVFDRSVRSLIFFAALYHDSAKPNVQTYDEQGRIRFFNHDQLGGELIGQRGNVLKLSNAEIDRLKLIVEGHMRPAHLARVGECPTPRAIYRFFRDTGEAGIDICLLSLADLLATYGPTIPTERWIRQLEVVKMLMEAWWETPPRKIKPEPLIRGDDLLLEFDLKPGPIIGRLLEMVREGQVEGEIKTREEALGFVNEHLETLKD